jgi:hypothetical protein
MLTVSYWEMFLFPFDSLKSSCVEKLPAYSLIKGGWILQTEHGNEDKAEFV